MCESPAAADGTADSMVWPSGGRGREQRAGGVTADIARRLAARYETGCWVGVVAHAIEAAERDEGGVRVATPDHYVGAAWAPPPGWAPRYPDVVVIGSPGADNALAQLLVHVPADAKLWLAARDDADLALVADILLAADRNLERYQRDALAAFAAAERARTRAEIASRYSDRDAGFERFRARVAGPRDR
jgi:hypothetical protein